MKIFPSLKSHTQLQCSISPMISCYYAVLLFLLVPLVGSSSAAATPLQIGVIAPLSGPFAQVGKEVVDAIQMSLEDLRQEPKLEVILNVEDDQYKATSGVTAFKKLTSVNRIVGLLNLSSPTIGAIYPLARKQDLPILQFGEQTEEPVDDNVFQISPGSMEGFKIFGSNAAARKSGLAIIFASEDATILRFVDAFKQGFGKNTEVVKLPSDTKDFNTLIASAMAKNPTWIVPFLMPDQAAVVINQLLARPTRPSFAIPLFQVSFQEYQRLIPNLAGLKDDLTCAFPLPNKAFRTKFFERYGYKVGSWGAFGYDGMKVLLTSYHERSRDWTASMASYSGDGASGPISFDKAGVRVPMYEFLRVGEFLDRDAH